MIYDNLNNLFLSYQTDLTLLSYPVLYNSHLSILLTDELDIHWHVSGKR